ncbi:MAG: hypothetical protein U0Y68_22180 [Blastocatellia bacterium]
MTSTGLVIPPNLVDVMRTTMSEANPLNVSIYALDARGCSGTSKVIAARAQLAIAISASSAAYNEGGSMTALAGSFKSSGNGRGQLADEQNKARCQNWRKAQAGFDCEHKR